MNYSIIIIITIFLFFFVVIISPYLLILGICCWIGVKSWSDICFGIESSLRRWVGDDSPIAGQLLSLWRIPNFLRKYLHNRQGDIIPIYLSAFAFPKPDIDIYIYIYLLIFYSPSSYKTHVSIYLIRLPPGVVPPAPLPNSSNPF